MEEVMGGWKLGSRKALKMNGQIHLVGALEPWNFYDFT